jgi:hypothetical protein
MNDHTFFLFSLLLYYIFKQAIVQITLIFTHGNTVAIGTQIQFNILTRDKTLSLTAYVYTRDQ